MTADTMWLYEDDDDHRLWFRCRKCLALSAEKNKGACVNLPMGNSHDFEAVVITVVALPPMAQTRSTEDIHFCPSDGACRCR